MKNKPIPIDKLYTKYLIEEVELQSWTFNYNASVPQGVKGMI